MTTTWSTASTFRTLSDPASSTPSFHDDRLDRVPDHRRLGDGCETDSRHFRFLPLARPITSSAHSASDQPGTFHRAISTAMGAAPRNPGRPQNDRVGASGAAPKLAIRRQVGVGCALTIPSTQVRQAGGQRTRRALASGMAAAFVGPSYIDTPSDVKRLFGRVGGKVRGRHTASNSA
jgi:hypothetical protein